MTRKEWERNYKKEYKRRLQKNFLKMIIATAVFYGIMCIIGIVVETLCNII